MQINIDKLAELSKLSLDSDNLPDREVLTEQMRDMIENLSLPEIDGNIPPLSKKDVMTLREDVPVQSMPRDAALANAPQTQAGCFVVPKTV